MDLTEINILNELKVKIFELTNIGVPSAFFAASFGGLLLDRESKLNLVKDSKRLIILGLKAPNVMTIYFEEHFERDI